MASIPERYTLVEEKFPVELPTIKVQSAKIIKSESVVKTAMIKSNIRSWVKYFFFLIIIKISKKYLKIQQKLYYFAVFSPKYFKIDSLASRPALAAQATVPIFLLETMSPLAKIFGFDV